MVKVTSSPRVLIPEQGPEVSGLCRQGGQYRLKARNVRWGCREQRFVHIDFATSVYVSPSPLGLETAATIKDNAPEAFPRAPKLIRSN